MPRPKKASDLIVFEEGAPDFRKGNWWATFKEARLFIPRGFMQAMKVLDLNTIEPLLNLTERASKGIAKTDWEDQLPSRHWGICKEAQFKLAAEEKPMVLSKIIITIETLNVYAGIKKISFDGYEQVECFAAGYRADGWNMQLHDEERGGPGFEAFLKGARRLSQEEPELLILDLANGMHATFGVVELLRTSFPDRNIKTKAAQRPPKSGVVPASPYLQAHPDFRTELVLA
jgi:hypothetical protein